MRRKGEGEGGRERRREGRKKSYSLLDNHFSLLLTLPQFFKAWIQNQDAHTVASGRD